MTNRRAQLLNRLAALPEELLPEVEQSIDDIENWHEGVYRLSAAEREAIRKGLVAAQNEDFIRDEEMAEFRDRHGR
jgi:hypothetical protein